LCSPTNRVCEPLEWVSLPMPAAEGIGVKIVAM
jgi:hypothetical protein